jgi:hypothetical protein
MIIVQQKSHEDEPHLLREIAPSFYVAEPSPVRERHPFELPDDYIPKVSTSELDASEGPEEECTGLLLE